MLHCRAATDAGVLCELFSNSSSSSAISSEPMCVKHELWPKASRAAPSYRRAGQARGQRAPEDRREARVERERLGVLLAHLQALDQLAAVRREARAAELARECVHLAHGARAAVPIPPQGRDQGCRS